MAHNPTRGVIRKVIVAAIVAAVAWVGGGALGFPPVFQVMFVLYAALGLAIFLLLDAPALPRLSGLKAGAVLIAFYTVLSAVYIFGAGALPQFDPDDEKGKIEKLLKAKRAKAEHDAGNLDELIKQTKEQETKVQSLLVRLNRFVPATPTGVGETDKPASGGGMTVLARGMEVYELHECYNCHKIGGKGSVKKRGPVLDNIGSLLTKDDIKKKTFDIAYLYAEGFEKEHKKGVMPDKYKELMTEEELDALASYLSTLKNPAVETPKPIFVKTKVEHGFIVYGYIRDGSGKPISDVDVQAKPIKEHAHAGSAKTNQDGYYEIFLHLHNEDAGTKVVVSAKGAQKEFVANYDPNDKVTKRQASVDLAVAAG
ncbi:MAG: c-type cytochrome [Nitrospiraceae bacterium]